MVLLISLFSPEVFAVVKKINVKEIYRIGV